MKLSGWQRIGIVASALWMTGAAVYVRNKQVESAFAFNSFQTNNCLPNDAIDACLRLATETFRDSQTGFLARC